eukprot:7270365-Prymnesium_polylepis.1
MPRREYSSARPRPMCCTSAANRVRSLENNVAATEIIEAGPAAGCRADSLSGVAIETACSAVGRADARCADVGVWLHPCVAGT